jgi:hypothetical protein
MKPASPKLMTRGRFALLCVGVAIGSSILPFRKYGETGHVDMTTIIIAVITFIIGIVIVSAVTWWANRPESGASNE